MKRRLVKKRVGIESRKRMFVRRAEIAKKGVATKINKRVTGRLCGTEIFVGTRRYHGACVVDPSRTTYELLSLSLSLPSQCLPNCGNSLMATSLV